MNEAGIIGKDIEHMITQKGKGSYRKHLHRHLHREDDVGNGKDAKIWNILGKSKSSVEGKSVEIVRSGRMEEEGKPPQLGSRGQPATSPQSAVRQQTASWGKARIGFVWQIGHLLFSGTCDIWQKGMCVTREMSMFECQAAEEEGQRIECILCVTLLKFLAGVQVLVNNKHVNQTWIRWGNQESVSDWYCTGPKDFCASCARLCFVR